MFFNLNLVNESRFIFFKERICWFDIFQLDVTLNPWLSNFLWAWRHCDIKGNGSNGLLTIIFIWLQPPHDIAGLGLTDRLAGCFLHYQNTSQPHIKWFFQLLRLGSGTRSTMGTQLRELSNPLISSITPHHHHHQMLDTISNNIIPTIIRKLKLYYIYLIKLYILIQYSLFNKNNIS